MKHPGITALAHPLDPKVATRHGVFVFEDVDEIRRKYREGNAAFITLCIDRCLLLLFQTLCVLPPWVK